MVLTERTFQLHDALSLRYPIYIYPIVSLASISDEEQQKPEIATPNYNSHNI